MRQKVAMSILFLSLLSVRILRIHLKFGASFDENIIAVPLVSIVRGGKYPDLSSSLALLSELLDRLSDKVALGSSRGIQQHTIAWCPQKVSNLGRLPIKYFAVGSEVDCRRDISRNWHRANINHTLIAMYDQLHIVRGTCHKDVKRLISMRLRGYVR